MATLRYSVSVTFGKKSDEMAVKIAVIGSGVIGLCSALQLKSNHEDVNIDILDSGNCDVVTSTGPPGMCRRLCGSHPRSRCNSFSTHKFHIFYIF